MSELREKLMYKPKHGYDRLTAEEIQEMEAYAKDYRAFLDNGKTERLCVDYTIQLAEEKGYQEEYALYEKVANMAPALIAEKRKVFKGVSPNVDFYSGLIYRMLDLPCELFTPLFAMARIAGWSAHRIEEIQNAGKIIRPAYISVKDNRDYIPMGDRLVE